MKHRGRILLDDGWRTALDDVAASRHFPSSIDIADLGAAVAKVSEAYNREGNDAVSSIDRKTALAARTLFFFPRDVAKGWGATRELARAGLLRKSPLRVLDLGAGVGAMTWGLAYALAEVVTEPVTIEATLVDGDAEALALASLFADRRTKVGDVTVSIRTERQIAPFSTTVAGGPFDLVLAGQLLSELDREMDAAERVKKHVRLTRSWLEGTTPEGALVVVEPALRERARHLQTIRDVFARERLATIFAPCLHDAPCPALERETDWCSEDRPIDLPSWLVPVAKAAGLRWEGSTFSYLVLRQDGVSLGQRLAGHPVRFRAVSGPIETKGKSEFFLCGVMPKDDGELRGRLRVTRLDRHESPENQAWSEALRGDLLAIEPPPVPRGQKDEARIDAATKVEKLDPKEGA